MKTFSESEKAVFNAAHQNVCALVEKFKAGTEKYLSAGYQESEARVDFLDPFWIALGWDVRHETQINPYQQEVKIEKGVTMAEGRKRADYAFYLVPDFNRVRFYVEAKKPSRALRNPDDCFQAVRYGWNSNVPLVVLSDFEEILLMDCRAKPDLASATARILESWHYTDWLDKDKFARFYFLFARPAIVDGAIERKLEELAEIKSATGRQGKLFRAASTPVDLEFLKQLEEWRAKLAIDFHAARPSLSASALTETTQRALDRLVFLRFLEDKAIETTERVSSWHGADAWRNFVAASRELDKSYNGVLWKKHDVLDDPDFKPYGNIQRAWSDIVFDISAAQSPYLFNLIPIPILGSIYERFLGNEIEIDALQKVLVALKPEARKAGGVYYTPDFIVQYIVAQTVGKIIENKTPDEMANLRFADIACGSGSFLLGVYDLLLRRHAEYFAAHPKDAKKAGCVLRDGVPVLSLNQRRAILENNIFGGDIDSQAVEVAKLSLYLKLLEDETAASARQFQLDFDEQILPDLENNIVCGNALVGFDVLKRSTPLAPEEERKLNAMDWQTTFPKIFRSGGFDAIVGNPPWGADFSQVAQGYMQKNYRSVKNSSPDSYVVFTERALSLLKGGGRLGYITPDTFMRKDNYLKTRELIFDETLICEIIETGPVFSQVRDTWCSVFVLEKGRPKTDHKIQHRQISRFIVSAEERLKKFGAGNWDKVGQVKQSTWQNRPRLVFGYSITEPEQAVISRIEAIGKSLSDLSSEFLISRGEEGSKFALREVEMGDFAIVIPANIKRYFVGDGIKISSSGLTPNKVRSLYEHPKIWITRIQKMRWQQRIVSALDTRVNSAGMKTLQVIVSCNDDIEHLSYLQAILSSKLMNFYCVNYLADDMNQTYLDKLPIRSIDFSNSADKARHDEIATLAQNLIAARGEFQSAQTENEKRYGERKVLTLDRQLDELVYALYDLTPEEIEVIEKAGG